MFESGIGINQSGQRLRTREWTPVLPNAVSLHNGSLHNGKPQRVEVDGVGLVLCRTANGQLAAVGESAGTSRSYGRRLDRSRPDRSPPWHGSRFAVESGEGLRGPAPAPLPCYQARVVDGMIEARGDGQHRRGARKRVAK